MTAQVLTDNKPEIITLQGADPWHTDHDRWIRDPMQPDEQNTGCTLPPFSLTTQRHSGYRSHPAWDAAVALALARHPQ